MLSSTIYDFIKLIVDSDYDDFGEVIDNNHVRRNGTTMRGGVIAFHNDSPIRDCVGDLMGYSHTTIINNKHNKGINNII